MNYFERSVFTLSLVLGSLTAIAQSAPAAAAKDSFGDVVSFVDQRSKLVVLSAPDGASIAVWPSKQGRVLTSSAEGRKGHGFGWVNTDLIASGKVQQHINALGGEDRLWLGPEGGQYSIFFAPGAPFDLDHWYTPAALDTEPFDVVSQTATDIKLRKTLTLTNYSKARFHVRIDRTVDLLTRAQIESDLKTSLPRTLKLVGYQSLNSLTNTASTPMHKDTGVLSLWVLGQFQSSPDTTIVLPVKDGPVSELGPIVKTDYFGPVPKDRISIQPNVVLFKADANYRSKLGLSPRRSKGVIGSYDPDHNTLTIIQFDQNPAADYVNSSWQIQKNPYAGDVANCYNDGVPGPGKPQLGRFYELESSSPAKALEPNATITHIQRTVHIVGAKNELAPIAMKVLGVHLSDLRLP